MFLPALICLVQETIDPRALALLEANEKALSALKSFRAETEQVSVSAAQSRRIVAQVLAGRPALLRAESWTLDAEGKKPDAPTLLTLSDGKTLIRQSGKTYTSNPANPATLSVSGAPMDGFYDAKRSLYSQVVAMKERKALDELKLIEPETIGGEKCQGVSYRYTLDLQGRKFTAESKLYFGSDSLIRKRVLSTKIGDGVASSNTMTVTKLERDVAVPEPTAFAYTPPEGVTLAKPAIPIARAGANGTATPAPPRPPLLAVGTEAPDFTVYTLDGKPVKLSDFRGKTVIMDFWATWCGPCMVTMPHIEKTWQKVKSRGDVVVLGVCVWDTKEKYTEWVPKNQDKFTFPLVLDPAGRAPENVAKKLYNVSGIPTTYIIDKDGKIAASFVGSRDIPAGVEPALKKLGIPVE